MRDILVVHGGAGRWPRNRDLDPVKRALVEALENGYRALKDKGAVDGVVEAVRSMEDSGVFNAGIGSVVNSEGGIEMDAGIMDGGSLKAGAVAAVTYPRNPILLARFVMEETDHVILAGRSADAWAKRLGLGRHPGPAERVLKRWREAMEKPGPWRDRWRRNLDLIMKYSATTLDTVGAVALDSEGRLAAAVSTGGVFMKLPGRVGDSPVPGAGFYADNRIAVAATGLGEAIILSNLSATVATLYTLGIPIRQACQAALSRLEKMFGKGTAGLIAVDSKGELCMDYNTEAMARGYYGDGMEKPFVAIFGEE